MSEKKSVIGTFKLLTVNQLILLSGAALYGTLYLVGGNIASGLAIIGFTLLLTGLCQFFKKREQYSICINILAYSQFILILGFGLLSQNLLATLPLIIASLAMGGLYYNPKLILKQWLIGALVLFGVLFFAPQLYGNVDLGNIIRGLLGINFCILLLYFLVKWGSSFMEQSAAKELQSESLLKQVETKMAESRNNALLQQQIFDEVRMRSNNLEGTSRRMLDIANTISQTSNDQNRIIEDVLQQSTAMKEEAYSTQEKTINSRDTAMQSVKKLELSNQRMHDILISINEIEASSEKISGIIQTIENIAFQTNILALNASVEAARAGTAGSGFAVVAQEVGMLASHSSEAANDSAALVNETIANVQVGVKLVKEAVKDMDSVISDSQYSADIAGQISEVMQIQVQSINNILQQIENISNITGQTATTAGESTTIAHEITEELYSINKAIQN